MKDVGLTLISDPAGRVKFSMAKATTVSGHELLLQKVLKTICQSPIQDAIGRVAGLGLARTVRHSDIGQIKASVIVGLQAIQDAISSEEVVDDDEALRFIALDDIFFGSSPSEGERFVGFSKEKRLRSIFIQISVASRSGRSTLLKVPVNDRTWYDEPI